MRITTRAVSPLIIASILLGTNARTIEAQDFSPAQVARVVAENSDALRSYSWSLRVEATIGGEERVGLYKVRYDFDGNLEMTPLDSGGGAELAETLEALGAFLRPYGRPGAYALHQFLNNAQIWEGRGGTANTVRIEGEDPLASDHP